MSPFSRLVFVPAAHTLLMCRGRRQPAPTEEQDDDHWSSINEGSEDRRVELLTA